MILTDLKVASPENTGLVCCYCDLPISRDGWAKTLTEAPTCDKCQRLIDPSDCEVEVESGSAAFLDKEAVQKVTWFHGTTLQEWDQKILAAHDAKKEVLLVHIGTRDAAEERIVTEKVNSCEPQDYYLYELKLKPEFTVSDCIIADRNNWPTTTAFKGQEDFEGDLVTRYLNCWESPGSISLLIAADAFEVVSVNPA